MRIKELLEELSKFPEDTEVYYEGCAIATLEQDQDYRDEPSYVNLIGWGAYEETKGKV